MHYFVLEFLPTTEASGESGTMERGLGYAIHMADRLSPDFLSIESLTAMLIILVNINFLYYISDFNLRIAKRVPQLNPGATSSIPADQLTVIYFIYLLHNRTQSINKRSDKVDRIKNVHSEA